MTYDPVQAVLDRLDNGRQHDGYHTARCPAHDDQHNSLSITRGNDGRALLRCHAGCSVTQVADALGMKVADLFPPRAGASIPLRPPKPRSVDPIARTGHSALAAKPGGKTHPRPAGRRTFAYSDTEGVEWVRFVSDGKKECYPRVRDHAGAPWRDGKSIAPTERIYRRANLIARPDARVQVVEGEGCANAMDAAGLLSITWRGGCASVTKAIPQLIPALAGRDVVLLPDADAPGRQAMRAIAVALRGTAASVRIVDLYADESGRDIEDWLHEGHDADELAQLVDATPAHEAHAQPADGWTPRIVNLADVQPERVRWLWPGYLPLGKVVVIDGDPGMGKSTLLSDLAARVTREASMPDGTRGDLDGPAGVVIMSAEDDPKDTIRPRLDAAGADVSRINALEAMECEGKERSVTLADLPAIEHAIVAADAALVIVDPLMAYLGSETDSHRDQDVRGILAPLARLAARYGVCICVVRHLSKGQSANAIYRGGGSIGIIGAARVALMVGRDPDDPEGPRRILAVSKSNLAMFPPAMAYHMEQAENGVARIIWEGTTHYSAAAITASVQPEAEGERSALDEAKDALRTILAGGALPADEVRAQAGKAGVADRTLDRAKTALRVKAHREGFGKEGIWYWTLPSAERGTDIHRTPNNPIERQQNSMALYGHVGVLSTGEPEVQRVHGRIAEHRAHFSMLAPETFQGVIGNLLASDGFSRAVIDRALAEASESRAQSAD